MSISNYLEDAILKAVLNNTSFSVAALYGSLHTGDPGESGTGNPLASCAREAIAFNAPVSSTGVNATTVEWTCNGTGTVTHIGLWDGSDTGTANFLWGGALSTSKVVANQGDLVRLASGQLAVTLD